MAVNKRKLIKLQDENSTLQRFTEVKGTETRKGCVVLYKKRGGIWYWIRQPKDEVGAT